MALSFRSDSIFPPQYVTLFVADDGRIVDDDGLLEIIQQPYKAAGCEGADFNLRPWRWERIRESGLYPLGDWNGLCVQVESAGRKMLAKEARYAEKAEEKVKKALEELELRESQMKTRFALMGDKLKRETESAQFALEKELRQMICEGIGSPETHLDSIEAIFVSKDNPFENEDT